MSELIFTPTESDKQNSNLWKYTKWLKDYHGLAFEDYNTLWQWSIENSADFWESILVYFNVQYQGHYSSIQSGDAMPYVKWFAGIELNYAEHLVRHQSQNPLAMLYTDESLGIQTLHWAEIIQQAGSLQHLFQQLGISKGERVAAYLPNIPEASISFLATIASGLIWTCCSPDFGSDACIDRFQQTEPSVFIAVKGYRYGGKFFDRTKEVLKILDRLPSLKCVLFLGDTIEKTSVQHQILWKDAVSRYTDSLMFTRVSFNDPLWIVYSSGTTGLPKAITHSHGGMLLEHLKYLHFHNDVHLKETFFWYTSTGWMMWNYLHASWLAGATIVLFDGHATAPVPDQLWKLAQQIKIVHFGTSAPFIHWCMKESINLPELSHIRSVSSTGSPLHMEAYEWLVQRLKHPYYLWSMSGGTDVATALVGGCPLLPIYKGEIQCIALGCDVQILQDNGKKALPGEVGELTIHQAMPCMPVFFWGDPEFVKYKEAYFDHFDGIWRHGDWIQRTVHQGYIISGRSDTTLKRYGIRIGTAEIYSALQTIQSIKDSIIIHIDRANNLPWMPLFVCLTAGTMLTDELKHEIKQILRTKCSPRHVPDDIIQVQDIPYTLSGKKMETLIKKVFMGKEMRSSASLGAVKNPDSINEYIALYQSGIF